MRTRVKELRTAFENTFLGAYRPDKLITAWRLRFALYCGLLLVGTMTLGAAIASFRLPISPVYIAAMPLGGAAMLLMLRLGVPAWIVIDSVIALLVGGLSYLLFSGVSSPIAMWFLVIPLAAVLLRGPAGGLAWTALISGILALLFGVIWTGEGRADMPDIFSHSWPVSVGIAYLTLVAFYGIGLFAERAMASAMARAERRNGELVDEVRRRKATERALENAIRHREELLTVISHDLNGPIGSLNELFALIDADHGRKAAPLDPAEIHAIRAQLSQLYFMTDNLLQWSRSQSHAGLPERVRTDCAALIAEEISFLAHRAADKGIAIDRSGRLAQPGPCEAVVDAHVLRIVARNLLQNAIKFSPRDSRISIGIELGPDNVALTVHDSGPGLPTGLMAGLAGGNPGHSTPGSSGERGHGVGLSVCVELLSRDGGRLTGSTRPEGGSEFQACFTREEV